MSPDGMVKKSKNRRRNGRKEAQKTQNKPVELL
jgi:hypothetical protein